ncbi:MAG TPA: peptide chain release factor N(5)-glutamine methyltransferase [Phycisphaerales bacterium]|nr:peptide chain release factor N(5)-glutamine methyltransferase [Phycisphaerales bacterium]
MSGDSGEPWTVLKLLNWTKDYFARREVDSPRLSAEVLLAHTLGCRRIELYTRFDHVPPDAQRDAFRELVRRAAEHEPVAYLTGEKEFYSLAFRVTPDVLVPRGETELLVSEAVAHLRAVCAGGRSATFWDACTGSGCVAVAVAVNVREARALATDLSPAALDVARDNARRNGVADRVRVEQADLLDLPDSCADLSPFDAITANPPYVAEGDAVAPSVRHEPRQALYAGADGLDCLRRLIAQAPARLGAGGMLAVEFGAGQTDAVRELIVAAGTLGEPRILRDHQGIERAAVTSKKA